MPVAPVVRALARWRRAGASAARRGSPCLAVLLALAPAAQSGTAAATQAPKLIFQTDRAWSPRTHVQADMVLAYGLDPSLAARIAGWRGHGYRVGFMTALAWGDYPDYLQGRFDGRPHHDQAQQAAAGRRLLHTGEQAPYFAPDAGYTAYLAQGVVRALDAGAEAVYLEEPEYWADAGWSTTFRKAWQAHYQRPWQAPDTSPHQQWLASRLKAKLFQQVAAGICTAVADWSRTHARPVPCNIATHSLLNYAQWRIVAPGDLLADLHPDGLIGQVWTGTARAPNVYRGQVAERPFEQAFLEYGALAAQAQAARAPIWMLADPVEDNPEHDWNDYRDNWKATLVASLLQPDSARYEVLPWPDRIFGLEVRYRDGQGHRQDIPADYQTVLQTVFHALAQMPDGGQWRSAGTAGTGVLVADSMMYQRAAPQASDPWIGDFHGLALPLLMQGMPVRPVPMEAVLRQPGLLSRYRLLLLSYHGQLPPSAEFTTRLAAWVRAGGALVLVDDDRNPYLGADRPPTATPAPSPRQQLFSRLALEDRPGLQQAGQGVVAWQADAPDALSHRADGADQVTALCAQAAARVGLDWRSAPALVMQRGPFVIAAGTADGPGQVLPGRYLDLLDPELAERLDPDIAAGSQHLWRDLATLGSAGPQLLAASGRTSALQVRPGRLHFELSGIQGRPGRDHAIVALDLPSAPTRIELDGKTLPADAWSWRQGVLRLQLPSTVQPQRVDIGMAAAKR